MSGPGPSRFVLADEQRAIRDVVRELVAKESSSATVRALADAPLGHDPAVWEQVVDVGLTGVLVPEALGGLGLGLTEMALVMTEMGRGLFPVPFLSTGVLAPLVLREAGSGAAADDLSRAIARGERKVALAWAEQGAGLDLSTLRCVARGTGDAVEVDGEKWGVVDGDVADDLLVVARGDAGLGLFLVEADAAPRTRLASLDLTRRFTRVTLAGTPARELSEGDVSAALGRALDRAGICLAAEEVGVAERGLEMAVAHATDRYQFGRPIGSFQAVKHKCADALLRVEASRSAVAGAAWAADHGAEDAGAAGGAEDAEEVARWASLCRTYCSEAAVWVTGECLQIHGGMGYTWEHDAHLYLRRAKTSSQILGSPAQHRRRLAGLLGIRPGATDRAARGPVPEGSR